MLARLQELLRVRLNESPRDYIAKQTDLAGTTYNRSETYLVAV